MKRLDFSLLDKILILITTSEQIFLRVVFNFFDDLLLLSFNLVLNNFDDLLFFNYFKFGLGYLVGMATLSIRVILKDSACEFLQLAWRGLVFQLPPRK